MRIAVAPRRFISGYGAVWFAIIATIKRVLLSRRLNILPRYIENARPYGKRCALPNISLGQRNNYKTEQTKVLYRGMAQFGSALDWGSRGHGFKSRYSDHKLRWVHTLYALIFLYPFNLRLRKRWNGYEKKSARIACRSLCSGTSESEVPQGMLCSTCACANVGTDMKKRARA